WDHTVQVWDVQNFSLITVYTRHSDFVDALAWSPDGRYLASGSWDDTVQVWNFQTKVLLFFYQYNEIVNAVAWSPNGRYLAVGGRDRYVHILNAKTGEQVLRYNGHAYQDSAVNAISGNGDSVVNTVAWSPDSRFIASGDRAHVVQVWSAA